MVNLGFGLAVHISLVIRLLVCNTGTVHGKTNSDEGEVEVPNNYKEAVFVYPQGIRSERDIPICQKWMDSGKQGVDGEEGETSTRPEGVVPSDRLAPGGSVSLDEGMRWESACNVVHKRFFYPPVVERLCRCTDRTECPWEWSQPPNYPNSLSPMPKGSRDPFTIMISSRSQVKFCGEVSTTLPRCKNVGGDKKSEGVSNMLKTIRRTVAGDETPSVSVNCFCPPLYRRWTFVEQIDSPEYGNGSLDTQFSYRCERLPRCQRDERCGNIRTDLHFTFYNCSCPKNHLCLPRKYPVESVEDVEEDVHEVLFHGQVAPAYCTPYP